MKVAILLFLCLSLFEPTDSHGLHAWTFMNSKNFGQRQEPEVSKDFVFNPIRTMDPLDVSRGAIRGNGQENIDDFSCEDIPAWTIRWFVYGCNLYATRQSNRLWRLWIS